MSNASSLLQSVQMKVDEMPMSYLMRLAWANGFNTAHSLTKLSSDFRVQDIPLMTPKVTNRISRWSGYSADELRDYAIPAGVIVPFGKSSVKRRSLRFRHSTTFCPRCLSSDFPAHEHYIRGPWAWRTLTHCYIHGARLITSALALPYTRAFSELLEGIEPDEEVELHPSDEYFYKRIAEAPGDGFLDQFPAYIAAEFCAVIGKFMASQGESSVRIMPRTTPDSKYRRMGYQIAVHGRDAVWEFLRDYVSSASQTISSYRLIYGPAVRWWRENMHIPEYRPLMELFQDHAENHVALGEGDLFFWPVARRKVHTIASAAHEYRIYRGRLESELKERMKLDTLPRFLKRSDIHLHLTEAQSYLSTKEAAEALGCPLSWIQKLVDDEYLYCSKVSAFNTSPMFHQADVDGIIETMKSTAASTDAVEGLVPLHSVPLPIVILKMILARRLTKIAIPPGPFQLPELLVDPTEISEMATGRDELPADMADLENEELIEFDSARTRVRASAAALRAIIDAGMIRMVLIPNRQHWKTRAKRWLYVEDIRKFNREHISLVHLAAQRDATTMQMRERLNQKGIRPVIDGKTFRFYRREDVKR
jgi:hypothetical protein